MTAHPELPHPRAADDTTPVSAERLEAPPRPRAQTAVRRKPSWRPVAEEL